MPSIGVAVPVVLVVLTVLAGLAGLYHKTDPPHLPSPTARGASPELSFYHPPPAVQGKAQAQPSCAGQSSPASQFNNRRGVIPAAAAVRCMHGSVNDGFPIRISISHITSITHITSSVGPRARGFPLSVTCICFSFALFPNRRSASSVLVLPCCYRAAVPCLFLAISLIGVYASQPCLTSPLAQDLHFQSVGRLRWAGTRLALPEGKEDMRGCAWICVLNRNTTQKSPNHQSTGRSQEPKPSFMSLPCLY